MHEALQLLPERNARRQQKRLDTSGVVRHKPCNNSTKQLTLARKMVREVAGRYAGRLGYSARREPHIAVPNQNMMRRIKNEFRGRAPRAVRSGRSSAYRRSYSSANPSGGGFWLLIHGCHCTHLTE